MSGYRGAGAGDPTPQRGSNLLHIRPHNGTNALCGETWIQRVELRGGDGRARANGRWDRVSSAGQNGRRAGRGGGSFSAPAEESGPRRGRSETVAVSRDGEYL